MKLEAYQMPKHSRAQQSSRVYYQKQDFTNLQSYDNNHFIFLTVMRKGHSCMSACVSWKFSKKTIFQLTHLYTFSISRYIDIQNILINIVTLISTISPASRLRSLNKTSTPIPLCSSNLTSCDTRLTLQAPFGGHWQTPCIHFIWHISPRWATSSPAPLQNPHALCM